MINLTIWLKLHKNVSGYIAESTNCVPNYYRSLYYFCKTLKLNCLKFAAPKVFRPRLKLTQTAGESTTGGFQVYLF